SSQSVSFRTNHENQTAIFNGRTVSRGSQHGVTHDQSQTLFGELSGNLQQTLSSLWSQIQSQQTFFAVVGAGLHANQILTHHHGTRIHKQDTIRLHVDSCPTRLFLSISQEDLYRRSLLLGT